MDLTHIWPTAAQIVGAIIGTGGISATVLAIISYRNGRGTSTAALVEATARADIARQLDTERTGRQTAERERDDATEAAARAGRERDAADRRAEAADRRANAERRAADAWEDHANVLREFCIDHGTRRDQLPARPAIHH